MEQSYSSDWYSTPYNVKPFYKASTINTTMHLNADRATVWPKLKAMDQWDFFQGTFFVDFINGNGVVELDQKIKIESNGIPLVNTIERYNEIVEEERLCWTLDGFELAGLISFPSPKWALRTSRCVELFDDVNNGTVLHNWISYAGFGWPFVIGFLGSTNEQLFKDFNSELAVEFV